MCGLQSPKWLAPNQLPAGGDPKLNSILTMKSGNKTGLPGSIVNILSVRIRCELTSSRMWVQLRVGVTFSVHLPHPR